MKPITDNVRVNFKGDVLAVNISKNLKINDFSDEKLFYGVLFTCENY